MIGPVGFSFTTFPLADFYSPKKKKKNVVMRPRYATAEEYNSTNKNGNIKSAKKKKGRGIARIDAFVRIPFRLEI